MLVVLSGKTTIGLFALLRIVSRELYMVCSVVVDGTAPVADIIDSRDTSLKPRTLERGVGVRAEGEEIAAEPVPVRRPGVTVIGLELLDVAFSVVGGSHTGRTKIGSSLIHVQHNSPRSESGEQSYLKASQSNSTHDAQFETIISPALGRHDSPPFVFRLINGKYNMSGCR